MEMPPQSAAEKNRIHQNLADAQLESAPPFFGAKIDWTDVSELLGMLHGPVRAAVKCVSKGQAMRAMEGLFVKNQMLEKRVQQLLADEPAARITAGGDLQSNIPPAVLLPLLKQYVEILQKEVDVAPAVAEAPGLKLVTSNDAPGAST